MGWLYHFLDLDHEEKLRRRELLNRYGTYAQLSILVPVLVFQLLRLIRWVIAERHRTKQDYSALPSSGIPGSPERKKSRQSFPGLISTRLNIFKWWLGGELLPGYGQRGIWLGGVLWALWLMFLSTAQTGNGINANFHTDYLHLTKRFGIIAASQFPAHYMLAMKSPYSPFALAFGASHERLNTFHRVSGRTIYFFLILHGALYLNYFIQTGVLQEKMASLVPVLGLSALSAMSVLMVTSLSWIRRWSYRAFFVAHLVIGVAILPILVFHAPPLRLYVIESLVLFILDLLARKLDTITTFSKITSIPHTRLLKLTVPIPASKIGRFQAIPGQHVYLSIPHASRPPDTLPLSLYEFFFNPFTVADVSETDITIVLRALHGPVTTALNRLTTLSKADPPVNIEGPYGEAQNIPNLAADFDRILLVAGGVGSSFILPLYNRLATVMSGEGQYPSRVTLVWSMRSIAEARWMNREESSKVFGEEDHVKIFLTAVSDEVNESFTPPEDGSVEMKDVNAEADQNITVSGGHTRPDLRKIVDETFQIGLEERVAVVVCGPPGMGRELRDYVGRWVTKGRSVWFHNETFGW